MCVSRPSLHRAPGPEATELGPEGAILVRVQQLEVSQDGHPSAKLKVAKLSLPSSHQTGFPMGGGGEGGLLRLKHSDLFLVHAQAFNPAILVVFPFQTLQATHLNVITA